MLRPLYLEVDGEQAIHLCAHWKNFPPKGAGREESPIDLRNSGQITPTEYQRIEVWEKMCGLTQMSTDKCPACPHIRRVIVKQNQAYIVDPTGRRLRLVEAALFEAGAARRGHLVVNLRPPGTHHSGKRAAWVVQAQKGEGDEG